MSSRRDVVVVWKSLPVPLLPMEGFTFHESPVYRCSFYRSSPGVLTTGEVQSRKLRPGSAQVQYSGEAYIWPGPLNNTRDAFRFIILFTRPAAVEIAVRRGENVEWCSSSQ